MEIMFEDLTFEAQMRLLDAAGVASPGEMNWDVVPVAIIRLEDEGQDSNGDFPAEGFFGELFD